VNIHDELPVRGRTVRDSAGHRLGRIVEIDYAATGTSEAWYLLRLTGWRREFRAVPAVSARRGTRRSVQLAFTRAAVLGSPQLSRQGRRHGVSRSELRAFYAPAGRV
jgi:hypothetical protein